MIGLIAFAILFTWLAVVIWIARRISRHLKTKPSVRPIVSIIAGVVIFWLPVADELAARPYFEVLCHRSAALKVNSQKLNGKTVRVTVNPSNASVKGSPIPMFHSHVEYRDATTGEVLVEYEIYSAIGGLLARTFGLAHSHPLTGAFFCAPEERETLRRRYTFTFSDRK
jgi:hypothetical protein